jgi:hypothetical protein
MKSQSFAVRSLKTQIAATLKLIGMGIKKYILQLLNLEAKLEEAMSEQIKPVQMSLLDMIPRYSETQIKEAFEAVGGCLKRYWKPEMIEIIPSLAGKGIVESSWDWMIQFPEVQKMEQLGWKDRVIGYAIDAANLLGK